MSNRISIEEFLKRSKNSHGDKYDYSNVEYNNQYDPVVIKCPIHGEFKQIPKSHMIGKGCRKCAYDNSREKYSGVEKINRLNKELIIKRLQNIHKQYDYNKCEIEGKRDKAIINNIICPIHGEFSKRLSNHLYSKQGCNKCGSNKSNLGDFIKKSNIIHQSKYDYSKSEYIKGHKKTAIICKKHGEFYQTPQKHLSGQGCPICYSLIKSKGESFIKKFLEDKNIKFEYQKSIPNTKLKMDFYIPSMNLCIEYDGIQHFEPRSRFGGDIEYKMQLERDRNKNDYCDRNNIKLIRIGYNFIILILIVLFHP
jgi:very-short-patch-repair endonuclease/ribosomal protein L40E